MTSKGFKFYFFFTIRTVFISAVVILTSLVNTYAQWNQLGIDIPGEAPGDISGQSVSLSADGLTIAIGAILNAGGGTQRGQVRVYHSISGVWTQVGSDIDGEANSDFSGGAVSLSSDGTIVAIGAAFNDAGGVDKGHVRVYKLVSGVWTQVGADIDGESDNDRSGTSVSMSADGSTVIIGAPMNAGTGGTTRGHARVYKFIAGAWNQQGADIDGDLDNDRAGMAVSISGDGSTIAVGIPRSPGSGFMRGRTKIYKLISGNWTQQGLNIDGEADQDQSATSVSLSSNGLSIAIGAPINAGGGSARGHVRVYQMISGSWVQQGLDIDGEANGDNSGAAVALSSDGTSVAIGAISNSGGGTRRGHVRVYKFISGAWTQQSTDIDGENDDDMSGKSVSLSANGSLVGIGATTNGPFGAFRGYARVFYFGPPCNPASATCPSNTITNTSSGICSALVSYISSSSGTPFPSMNYSFTGVTTGSGSGNGSGLSFTKGITTVTLTAANICGSQSCSFTVTVNDHQNPTITCPANITLNADPGVCSKTVTYSATSSDNCTVASINFSTPSGSSFSVGTQTVTATATDASANTAQCNFTVKINDTQLPVITCPANIIQNATIGLCSKIVSFTATATDNCPGTIITHTKPSGSSFNIGITIDTATATDASGNNAKCTFTVTIDEHESPVITCPANITQALTIGETSKIVTFSANATDNCSIPTISYNPASGSSFFAGTTSVTATANDGHGNTSQCSFTVTVIAPYEITSLNQTCVSPTFCLSVAALDSVKNVIGYDFVLNYDTAKVIPTGSVIVNSDLTDSTKVDVAISIDQLHGKMNISLYFNAGAPTGDTWHGDHGGKIMCVQFAKRPYPLFGYQDTAVFSVSLLQESYVNGVKFPQASAGKFTTYKDSSMTASLRFWVDNSPIVFTNASQHLITNIYGTTNATNDVNGSCANRSAIPVQPNATGNFTHNIWNGTYLDIERDILGTTSVQSVVNGYDVYLVRRVLILDPTFMPSIFQMIAMDVNRDGVISAGDASQIAQRAVLQYPEFSQSWNYNSDGTHIPSTGNSKDWTFMLGSSIATTPAFGISTFYPADNGVGYSKYRVPVIPFCLPAPVTNATDCPIITNNETYIGIMLGDVNGNYSSLPSSPTLRSSERVIFDLSKAISTSDYIDIPVSIVSGSEIHALDFSMQFNDHALTYHSIHSNTSDIQMYDHFNTEDNTLRFTSNSLDRYDLSKPILFIRCNLKNGKSNMEDLLSMNSYLNGQKVPTEIRNSNDATSKRNVIVNVYPNPSFGMFYVSVEEDANIQLYDIDGKEVILRTKVIANKEKEVNASKLESGIYLMKICNNNFIATKMILINK